MNVTTTGFHRFYNSLLQYHVEFASTVGNLPCPWQVSGPTHKKRRIDQFETLGRVRRLTEGNAVRKGSSGSAFATS